MRPDAGCISSEDFHYGSARIRVMSFWGLAY